MKTLIVSLAALAAISGSALAEPGTSHDDRGLSLQKPVYGTAKNSTASKAFAIPTRSTPLTAVELMMQNADDNNRNADHRSGNEPEA